MNKEGVMNEDGSLNEGIVSTEQTPRRIGRSILAVLAGMIAGAVLSLGTDAALRAAGVFPALGERPTDSALLLAITYRTVYSVTGCYLAGAARAVQTNGPCHHAGNHRLHRLHAGRPGDLEQGTRVWPALVSHRTGRYNMPYAWLGGVLYRSKQN